jgi:hypothetical protein
LLLYSSYLPLGISQLAGHLLHHHHAIYSNHWTEEEESLVCCTCASFRGAATCGVGSDQITRKRVLVQLHHPRFVEHFCCAISSRVWISHLSLLLIISPRLDLGFLVCICRNFFDLLCCETLQWVQMRQRLLQRGSGGCSK